MLTSINSDTQTINTQMLYNSKDAHFTGGEVGGGWSAMVVCTILVKFTFVDLKTPIKSHNTRFLPSLKSNFMI